MGVAGEEARSIYDPLHAWAVPSYVEKSLDLRHIEHSIGGGGPEEPGIHLGLGLKSEKMALGVPCLLPEGIERLIPSVPGTGHEHHVHRLPVAGVLVDYLVELLNRGEGVFQVFLLYPLAPAASDEPAEGVFSGNELSSEEQVVLVYDLVDPPPELLVETQDLINVVGAVYPLWKSAHHYPYGFPKPEDGPGYILLKKRHAVSHDPPNS